MKLSDLHEAPRLKSVGREKAWHASVVLLIGLALLFAQTTPGLFAARAESTNLGALPPPPLPLPDAGFSILRVFGALTLVIALFLAGVWVFRNWHRVSAQRGAQQLRIIESRSLGGRHALYVVGYQTQRLLVASSPSGVSLVSHLPAAESESGPEGLGAGPAGGVSGKGSGGIGPAFVQVLQQAIQRKP